MTDKQTSVKDMKTITFEGKEYEVPVWVKWVAKDADGTVCAFKLKPEACDKGRLWYTSLEDRYIEIDKKASWAEAIAEV